MSFWDDFEDDGKTNTTSILSKDNFTIYEVFDQEDIISEAGAHSNALTEYLIKDEQLTKMFDLMTTKSNINDNDNQFKYPWICCEIFRINITSITERLFEDNCKYLRSYSEILDRNSPLDNLQAEYYSRIISKFLELRKEKTLNFLFSVENYFEKLVRHIENGSILNLFQSLIDSLCIEVEDKGEFPGMIIEDKKEGDEDNEDRNYRVKRSLDDKYALKIVQEKVIKNLMQQIGPNKTILTNENIAEAISFCVERSIHGSPIRNELQGDNGIGALVQVLKNIDLSSDDERANSAFVSGVDIMIKILFITPKKSYEQSKTKEELPLSVQYVSELVSKFVPYLDTPSYLKCSQSKKEIIGVKRMKILEFVDSLVTVQYQYLDALMTTHKTFIRILKLFFKLENNNLVQRVVSNTFVKIFNGPSDKLKQFIISSPIFDALLIEFLNNEKYPYKAYRGFLIEIISIFQDMAVNYLPMQNRIKGNETWNKMIPLLEEAKKVESSLIGGGAPIHVSRDVNFISTKDIDMIGSGNTNN